MALERGMILLDQERALKAVAELSEEQWKVLPSKAVPESITNYVVSALETQTVDEVRRSLGMRSQTDPRWAKIMGSLRTGKKIDIVGIFSQWLDRNAALAALIDKNLKDKFEQNKMFSKMDFEAVTAVSALQLNTIKMGKELGVFVDPADQRQLGGGGVTIVVQTMVPSPSKEVIIASQKAEEEKTRVLVEQHRPKEKA